MHRMRTQLTRSRGAAAAFLLTAIAPAIAAQATEPARARPRDSVFVQMFKMPGVSMDSIRVLVQALEREQYGSADWLAITRHVDSLLVGAKREMVARGLAERNFFPRTAGPFPPTGWLGFVTQGPSQQIFDRAGQHVIYFAYPQIISVDPNSPAERAGITRGDTLVAYDGLDVVNRDFNLTELLRPDRRVSITIRRDGANKDYAVRVARGPARIFARRQDLGAESPAEVRVEIPDLPDAFGGVPVPALAPAPAPVFARTFRISRDGMFGASLSAVSGALAKALNLKVGVLANEVPEDSPAWRDGLRPGDVIVSVEDAPVRSVAEFRDRVMTMTQLPQHSVAVQVVRNQKPRTIRLTWPSP
jgi:C-terminal processing protease CtpA/Prc